MILTVIWPLYILLDSNEEISVENGGFINRENVIASKLHLVKQDNTLELSDDELHMLDPKEKYELMHKNSDRSGQWWNLNPGYRFPIKGLVYECRHWNKSTLINICVIDQNPYDFRNAIKARAAIAIPAFWADSDIENKWKEICPDTQRQWEIRKNRPKINTEEAIVARTAVANLYKKHHCLDLSKFMQYTGDAEVKLSYVERQRNRLIYIRDVRMCIYKTAVNPDPSNILLEETRYESLLTIEALCFFAMASLDLLARTVDHLLSVTVSPTQRRSRTTFVGLLGCRESDDECDEPKKTLDSQYSELQITRLWRNAWNEWIEPLAKRRHKLTHDSILYPVEVPHSGASFTDQSFEDSDITRMRIEDALEFATNIAEKLRMLFTNSFINIAQMAQLWTEQNIMDLPKYNPNLQQQECSPTNINLEEALNAWIAVGEGNEKDVKTFYYRVHSDLKNVWKLSQCESFLRSNKLTSYNIYKNTEHTDNRYGQINLKLARMTVDNREIDVWFSVVRVRSDRWHIIREPISTFPDPIVRLECINMWRRQSDRNSGFRDVLYGATIKNISDEQLSNIEVTLFQGLQTYEYKELQTINVGSLIPNATAPLDCRLIGGCLPPYDFRLLSGPLSLRFCYDTVDGQRYAVDFPYNKPAK